MSFHRRGLYFFILSILLAASLSGCFAPASSLRGKAQAKRDWERHRAVTMTCGYPVFHLCPESRFYVHSSGCVIYPGDRAYANAYNRTIDRLVERDGIPEWAPCHRYMTETEARDHALQHALPVAQYITRSETSEQDRTWATALRNAGILVCDCPKKTTLMTVEHDASTGVSTITVYDGHPDWRGNFMNRYPFNRDMELTSLFEK